MRKYTTLFFIAALAFYPSISQHREMKPVDPKQFKLLPQSASFKGEKSISVVLFDETGTKLLTGGWEHRITCFDVSTGKQVWKAEGENIEASSAVDMFSLDVPLLVVANNMFSGGGVNVYHWESGEMLGELSPYARGLHGLTYSLSGEIFWFAPGGIMLGFSIVNNSFVTSTSGLEGHTGEEHAVRQGPFEHMYSAGNDGKFIKWAFAYDESTELKSYTGEKEVLFTAQNPIISFAMNKYINKSSFGDPGAGVFAAIGENKGTVRVFDLSNRTKGTPAKSLTTIATPDVYPGNMSFHSTDPNLLIVTGKQSILFYNFKENKLLHRINTPGEVRGFDLSLDGTKLAVGLSTGEVQVYSL